MREVEFLPDWYAATHRRRRLLKLQMYCTVVVALSLATWGIVNAQTVEHGQRLYDERQVELQTSSMRVFERQEQDRLRAQYQLQQRVGASLGLSVESSRVLQLIEAAMPRHGSLIDLQIDTEERPLSLASRAQAVKSGSTRRELERRLVVVFKGVAPTNAEVVSLYDNLKNTGYCEDIGLSYAKDRIDGDYLMREFVIRFAINLNADGGTP